MKTLIKNSLLISTLCFSGLALAQGAMGGGGGAGGGAAGGMAAGGAAAGGMAAGGAMAEAAPRDRCTEETKGQLPVNVAAADGNGNGVVDKEELAEWVAGGQLDNLFDRWDADGSGGLDSQEFCFRQ